MSDLIEKLLDLRSQFNCFDENKYEAYRTLSEAIKVLSEQQEPCEDAVSREAIMKHYNDGELSHVYYLSRNNLLDYIESLPSVTPKRKTGKWIHSDFSHEFLHCSQCGRGRHFCSNFCPNCGADMRQKEESK